MKIIGFGITRLLGERKGSNSANMNLNQNINVKDVFKEKLDITEEDVITIKFVFSIIYSNDFGKVEVEGNVLILPDKDEVKEFSKSLKEKSIPDRFKTLVFNFIMSKCNIKALSIEDELSLPYHVPMPKLTPIQKKED